MKFGYFVTGTDTGVGKTLVTAALVATFARQGLRSAGMKPVASGCQVRDGTLWSDDAAMLRAASNVDVPLALTNPYAFAPPLAPHIAADQSGGRIALPRIMATFQQLARQVDVLVVEGVGGFHVPLNASEDTADLAAALGLPVVMVVGMRLGCINHALLTAQAVVSRGLPLAGWVANQIDPAMAAVEENIAALTLRIDAPCLGCIPSMAQPEWQSASGFLYQEKLIQKGSVASDFG